MLGLLASGLSQNVIARRYSISRSTVSRCCSNCYRFLLFLTATVVTMIDFGLVFSFGAMFVTMAETFHTDRAATATVQSILIGVTLSFGAISGVLISKVGLPFVTFVGSLLVPLGLCISFFATDVVFIYFTIGIVSGIGVSMTYISCVVAIGREFTGSKRTLCLAILNTSHIVASIGYPYCLEWLTEQYGLMGTFLILGGVSLNTLIFFLMCFIHRNKAKNRELIACNDADNDRNLHTKPKVSFRNYGLRILNVFLQSKKYMSKAYLFILVATGILLSSLDGYLSLMLDIALWKQINFSRALFTFVIYSSFSAVSCLLPGLLKQMRGIDSCIYPICSALSGGIGLLIVYFSNDYITYIVGTSFIGAAYGGILSSSMLAVVTIVEIEFVPLATGLLLTLEGLLAAGTGPLFGWIRDTTGSYGSVLVTIVSVHGVSLVMYVLAMVLRRLDKTKAQLIAIVETQQIIEEIPKQN